MLGRDLSEMQLLSTIPLPGKELSLYSFFPFFLLFLQEISNDANERNSHQKEDDGHNTLRPYHVLKHNLHKHHHHHNKGKTDTRHDIYIYIRNPEKDIRLRRRCKKEYEIDVTKSLVFIPELSGEGMKCPARRYGCQHYCIHLPDGGHRCMCHHGYILAPNGRYCEGLF